MSAFFGGPGPVDEAYLESMHEEAEESHKVGQLGRLEFSHDPRYELGNKFGHSGTDGIDELRERESGL
jgi:hypothetical protein